MGRRVSLRRACLGATVAAVTGLGWVAPALGAATDLTVTAPVSGGVSNQPITFGGTASTDPGDAATVTLNVYAGSGTSGMLVESLAPMHAAAAPGSWSAAASPPLADGTYTAQAVQQLTGMLTATSPAVTFTVDTTAPGVTLAAQAPRKGDPTPTFSGAAGNAPGDAPAVSLRVYPGAVAAGTPVRDMTVPRAAGFWSADAFPPLADGTYTAQATQADSAGNLGTSGSTTFTIDTTAPAVSLDSPEANSVIPDTRPTFRGGAGTGPGDLSTVILNVYRGTGTGGTRVQSLPATQSFGSWSATPSTLAEGVYTARAEQLDDLGHRGYSDTHTFTIQKGAFASSGPASPPVVRGVVLLSPFPIVRVAGRVTRTGATLRLLTVGAPAGARVEVSCRGKGCPRRRQSRVAPGRAGTRGLRLVSFPAFARALRAGIVLEIRITRSGRIGKYTRFVIRRNASPRRADSCLKPGRSKPTACPAS